MKQFSNPFRRPIALVTTISWVPLLLLGSGTITPLAPASAQQRLPQPRIFDELPPPSPSFPSPSNSPPAPSPSLPPDDPTTGREYNFQAPIPPSTPSRAANLYRVDIYGDSPLLLSQVRRLEPEAFVRQGEGIIQAGLFVDQFNAQSRVRALEAQGIRARITPVNAGTVAGRVDSGRLISDSPQANFGLRSYFVVIPGHPRDLANIADQVVRLGVGRNAVNQRALPRGPHIAVGPFDERGEAERWSSYLRSVGMDARVYFGG